MDADCDDGLWCNGAEQCEKGLCVDAPDRCPSNLICLEGRQLCVECTRDVDCDDGVWCDGPEVCEAGKCKEGEPPCRGGAPLCDEHAEKCLGCRSDVDCDDGVFCNGAEFCDAYGKCREGVPPCVPKHYKHDGRGEYTPYNDTHVQHRTLAGARSKVAVRRARLAGTLQVRARREVPGLVSVSRDLVHASYNDTLVVCDEKRDTCVECLKDAHCDDGNFCNGPESCNYATGRCEPGRPPVCADDIECTEDFCDAQINACRHVPKDARCNDGNFCNGAEACAPQNAAADSRGCIPAVGPTCDDGIDCTRDRCNERDQRCEHIPVDADCSDGAFCNGVESCDTQYGCRNATIVPCVGTAHPLCDEGRDKCVECVRDEACDDGKFCNGAETCNAATGKCEAGTPPDCDDAIECTLDLCDWATDSCVNRPFNGACNDGDKCNGSEVCRPGVGCVPSDTPVDCDDSIDCTDDVCNDETGECMHKPRDSVCDDGVFCNGYERCDTGLGCVPGAPPCGDDDDEDDKPYNGDGWSRRTAASLRAAAEAKRHARCDEDADKCVECLTDEHCDDGVFCNGQEACDPDRHYCVAGRYPCAGTVPLCSEDHDCCVACFYDSHCDDGQYCNGLEICDPVTFKCVATAVPDCDDAVSCTVDYCDEYKDKCVHKPNNRLCGDGDACNGVEECNPWDPDANAYGCVPADQSIDCDDNIACTVDACDTESGLCANEPEDVLCSDGLWCNGDEVCDGDAGCLPGAPRCGGATPICKERQQQCVQCSSNEHCDDGIECTFDVCNAYHECEHRPLNRRCDDGQYCNGPEVCDPDHDAADDASGCRDGQRPCRGALPFCKEDSDTCVECKLDSQCDDHIECTYDACVDYECVNQPKDTRCDDGKFCNGEESCDPYDPYADEASGCVPGQPPCIEYEHYDDQQGGYVDEPAGDNHYLYTRGVDDHDGYDEYDGHDHHEGDGAHDGEEFNALDGGWSRDGYTYRPRRRKSLVCDEYADKCVYDGDHHGGKHCYTDADCDDAKFCNGQEACDPYTKKCVKGEAPTCDDAVACTVDLCDYLSDECVHIPNNRLCSDGAYCNGKEVCRPADPAANDDGCVVEVNKPACDDGVQCTVDVCNEDDDECVHSCDNSFCDDGLYCNGQEICDPWKGCLPGTFPCASPDECELPGICDEELDFCYFDPGCGVLGPCLTDEQCDNGLFCDGTEFCSEEGFCATGSPPDCDDGIDCTRDVCDEVNDVCRHARTNAACDDGLYCNGQEVCDERRDDADEATGCAPGLPVLCDDGIDCTVDACDEDNDTCAHGCDNFFCDDGKYCNGAERCLAGVGCIPGAAPHCDDGLSCTEDYCSERQDACVHKPVDRRCKDGEYCNGRERCDPTDPSSSPESGCAPPRIAAECSPVFFDSFGALDPAAPLSKWGYLTVPEFGNWTYDDAAIELFDGGARIGGQFVKDVLPPFPAPPADSLPLDANTGPRSVLTSGPIPFDHARKLRFEAEIRGASTPGTADHPYGDAVADAASDARLGFGAIGFLDENHRVSALVITNTTIEFDHETFGILNAPTSAASNVWGVGNRDVDEWVRLAIELDGPSASLTAYVDSVEVFTVPYASFTSQTGDALRAQYNELADTPALPAAVLPMIIRGTPLWMRTGDDARGLLDVSSGNFPWVEPTSFVANRNGEPGQFNWGNGFNLEIRSFVVWDCPGGTGSPCRSVPDCDDGIDCTEDLCDAETGMCVHTPVDALCDDGVWCNGLERCAPAHPDSGYASGCLAGRPPCTCDGHDGHGADGDDRDYRDYDYGSRQQSRTHGDSYYDKHHKCKNVCVEESRECRVCARDADCDDGYFCNGSETCDYYTGKCLPGRRPCGYGEVCDEDTDSCAACHVDADCDDGRWCNGAEVCWYGQCKPGVSPCEHGSCDEYKRSCSECYRDADCPYGKAHCLHGQCVGRCEGGRVDCDSYPGKPVCDYNTDTCVQCLTDEHCDDGNACNGQEVCDRYRKVCKPGVPLDCDDGYGCTLDSCDPYAGCVNSPKDRFCPTGPCGGRGACDPADPAADHYTGCTPPPANPCDDGIDCTLDSCNQETDECEFVPDDGACADGDYCNGAEVCDPYGGCVPGDHPCPPETPKCIEHGGQPMCVECIKEIDCDDGNYCNGTENCVNNVCEPGTPVVCDDGFSCTDDVCDEINDVCRHIRKNARCMNGDFCDGSEVCDPDADDAHEESGCAPGLPVDCDDGIGCTIDTCDEETNTCVHTPDDAPCQDDSFCNGAEVCDPAAGCVAGEPPCPTGEFCEWLCAEDIDFCYIDPNCGGGCGEDPELCGPCVPGRDDLCVNDYFCDGDEVCNPDTSTCEPGTPVDCDDGVDCTEDVCDEINDVCRHVGRDERCPDLCGDAYVCNTVDGCVPVDPHTCDDHIDCTIDACDQGTNECTHGCDNNYCNDGLYCNGVERCDGWQGCVPGLPPCPAPGAPFCLEHAQDCVECLTNADCDDGHFCNGRERCDPGSHTCKSGAPPSCDDGVTCTADACDEEADDCVNVPKNSLCNDGGFCNGGERCEPANPDADADGCVPADEPVDCDDGVRCTIDVCNEDDNTCVNACDNAFCDDGQFCNGQETCDPVLGCVPGVPPCPTGQFCEWICDEQVDFCYIDPTCGGGCGENPDFCGPCVPGADYMCDNGTFCDGPETCSETGLCVPGELPDCSDGIDCTDDQCDTNTDACINLPVNDACNDGGFCNGSEVCDPAQGCVPAGDTPDCDDGVECTADQCDPETDMCEHIPDNAACDDGLFCTGIETCDPLKGCASAGDPCVGTALPFCDEGKACCVECTTDAHCDDHISCTLDACNPKTWACVHRPDDAACDDGDFCNGHEVCHPYRDCVSTNPPCEPPTPMCDSDTQTCSGCGVDADCDDGLYCNGPEACDVQSGACVAGQPVVCSDGVSCTADTCAEELAACVHGCVNDRCDDGNPCTVDVCDAGRGCVHVFSSAACATGCDDAQIARLRVYGVNEVRVSDSQFFSFNPDSGAVAPIGGVHPAADFAGLDIQPGTGKLYGVTAGEGGEAHAGRLYQVDRLTGELAGGLHLNYTGSYREALSLSFDSTGLLWISVANVGLYTANVTTGQLQLAYEIPNTLPPALLGNELARRWEGIAWAADGRVLYASAGTALIAWDPSTRAVYTPCGTDFLEVHTTGLDASPFGDLLGSYTNRDGAYQIYQIDPVQCVKSTPSWNLAGLTDIEGLAFELVCESVCFDEDVPGSSPCTAPSCANSLDDSFDEAARQELAFRLNLYGGKQPGDTSVDRPPAFSLGDDAQLQIDGQHTVKSVGEWYAQAREALECAGRLYDDIETCDDVVAGVGRIHEAIAIFAGLNGLGGDVLSAEDWELSSAARFPSAGLFVTLAFEDNIDSTDMDLDYNDWVVHARIAHGYDADGRLVGGYGNYIPLARGAWWNSDFRLALDGAPDANTTLSYVGPTIVNGPGCSVIAHYDAGGATASVFETQTDLGADIQLAPSTCDTITQPKELYEADFHTRFANTVPHLPCVLPNTTIDHTWTTAERQANVLGISSALPGIPHYYYFIKVPFTGVDKTIVQYDAATHTVFNPQDISPASDAPCGVVVGGNWIWPTEFGSVTDVYPYFAQFAAWLANPANPLPDKAADWWAPANGLFEPENSDTFYQRAGAACCSLGVCPDEPVGGQLPDQDGDGFNVCTAVLDPDLPHFDCDDLDPDVFPGAPEACDGKDNDCDGDIDEDFDLDVDPNNCGGCGIVCDPVYMNASVVCVDGVCAIGQCIEGCFDIDGQTANGCECCDNDRDGFCAPRSDDQEDCDDSDPSVCPICAEVCDGKDNDCDGFVDNGDLCHLRNVHANGCCKFEGTATKCAVETCEIGWADCNNRFDDGCETNVLQDSQNCGSCIDIGTGSWHGVWCAACGNVCGDGETCVDGVCTPPV